MKKIKIYKLLFLFLIYILFFKSFIFCTEFIDSLKEQIGLTEAKLRDAETKRKIFSRTSSPLKIYGYFTSRFQNITAFERGRCNHSAMEEYMSLWFDGTLGEQNFKLLFSLERPRDDAREIPNYWGTGRTLIDEFVLKLNSDNLKLSLGTIWEDTFLLKNILTDRPMLFEKDIYQSSNEETKSKYDIAFLKGHISRDYRWQKVMLTGADATFNIFNKELLLIFARAKNFYNDYSPTYKYVYDATFKMGKILDEFLFINKVEFNFEGFSISNDPSEVRALNGDINKLKENNTTWLGNTNIKIFDSIIFNFTYSKSFYSNYRFCDLTGEYYKSNIILDPIGILIGFRMPIAISIFKIDPDYRALLGNVVDTRKRGDSDLEIQDKFFTDIQDTTLFSNNSQGILFNIKLKIPNILGNINYGIRKQIEPTGPEIVNAHFLNGQNLNMALWWHIFYSGYGYPDVTRDKNFLEYNKTYADLNGNTGVYRYILTSGWRNNQEIIILNERGKSQKQWANINVDLRFNVGKFINLSQPFYLQTYLEFSALDNSDIYFPFFDSSKLFLININDFILTYNIIDPVNLILNYGIENWNSKKSAGFDVDYSYKNYGMGIDYDLMKDVDIYLKIKFFQFEDKIKPANNYNGYFIFSEVKKFF